MVDLNLNVTLKSLRFSIRNFMVDLKVVYFCLVKATIPVCKYLLTVLNENTRPTFIDFVQVLLWLILNRYCKSSH